MRREERVTVQGPVKEQQPDGMSQRGVTPPPLYRPPNGCTERWALWVPDTPEIFVLGIRQGEIFLFDPMCLYSKYSEICGEIKNG